MKLELHPLCALFPRMTGKDFEALKSDIAANGLRQPIVTHRGSILDGGNRYEACLAVGVSPITEEFAGTNLVTYVMSANFHRRHLNEGQQATIVATATNWANAQVHGGDRKSDQESLVSLETTKSRAAISGAGLTTQKKADKLARENPEIAKQVVSGEKTLYQATKELKPVTVQSDKAEEEYTELDAAHDTIEDLQAALAVATINSTDSEEAAHAASLIAELRTQVKNLTVNLKAVTLSRDTLMTELAMVKRQCVSLQSKIKKMEAR